MEISDLGSPKDQKLTLKFQASSNDLCQNCLCLKKQALMKSMLTAIIKFDYCSNQRLRGNPLSYLDYFSLNAFKI